MLAEHYFMVALQFTSICGVILRIANSRETTNRTGTSSQCFVFRPFLLEGFNLTDIYIHDQINPG